MSFYDVLTIPCMGCHKPVVVPAGAQKQAAREGKHRPVFCSKKCNATYVAREGARQQQRLEEKASHDA